MEEAIRLNKYLSDAGVCSRREADRLIEAGKVLVDGQTASMGMKVAPGQTVVCDGKTVGGKDKPVFLAVNKPRGIVCTTSDKDQAENIVEFLNYPQRIYPVGRLDKDSEGLLLMTNQGDIVNKILRGGNNHEKEYAVAVNHPVTEEFLQKMREGVWIEDLAVKTKPCKAWKTGPYTFHIILTQGLNRQIRRMCRALDFHVKHLKRVRMMNITLGGLERGQYRELTEAEVAEIRRLVKDSTNLPMQAAMAGKPASVTRKPADPTRRPAAATEKASDTTRKPAASPRRPASPRIRRHAPDGPPPDRKGGAEMDDRLKRMKELAAVLSEASRAYYQESRELMSNLEYDRLYDELLRLEEETGTVFAGSPTQKVGYEVLSELPRERHEKPMLSLNKTKSVDELKEWLGNQTGLLSWKMDGLTVVLTYENGVLSKAVTRGNGEIGEVITGNARTFVNLPMSIPYKERLILRGEAVITYSDFEKLNASIADADARYKNPQNLCSGSVRQLNSAVTASRNVRFMAFSLVQADGVDFKNSRKEQFLWLASMGFEVEFVEVTPETLEAAVEDFSRRIEDSDIPSDGLVLLYDDIAYGASLGRTAKFPRDSIAFKWADELQETTLSYIEWSASRTGLINPVAVFQPVELEGTTVSRASVHNLSIMEGLELGAGDRITVYKANMIIPQIADNLTRSGVRDIPAHCPVCGGATEIRSVNDIKSLYCTNPDCQAKKIKAFDLFVSRDALISTVFQK